MVHLLGGVFTECMNSAPADWAPPQVGEQRTVAPDAGRNVKVTSPCCPPLAATRTCYLLHLSSYSISIEGILQSVDLSGESALFAHSARRLDGISYTVWVRSRSESVTRSLITHYSPVPDLCPVSSARQLGGREHIKLTGCTRSPLARHLHKEVIQELFSSASCLL